MINAPAARTTTRLGSVAAVGALLLAAGAGAQQPTALTGGVFLHDPSSIVKHQDAYYLFSTGRGVRVKRSQDLLHWEDQPSVFDRGAAPDWTGQAVEGFRGSCWAPDIIKVKDRYLLYYSVSRFGKQTSAIGLASNTTLDRDSPDYAWHDAGPVIQSQPGEPYNAIDPSLLLTTEGRLWMAFGSYWKGIYLVELSPETGLRLDAETPPTRLAWAEMIEAATLIERDGWYYLFVNHGLCCRGVDSTYEIRVGRSRNVSGPFVDSQGRPLTEGGGDLVLGTDARRVGPGHVAPLAEAPTDRFGFHFYDGAQRGWSKLGMAQWQWSQDGWPTAHNVVLGTPDASRRRGRRGRPTPSAP